MSLVTNIKYTKVQKVVN